ncbi:tyrosine-type recombinase/integrase [Streptomyces sp. CAI-85]|uniref:tyrosine-type recombinase/integrase n=1 Tax=Streptomyces sp. CAI-85 TaxID=1472662 RepID=UPI0015876262|nr:tyrosine-type recombinase/integrase [Streptomyces sp. CAI-85]NUV61939.1 tyrosine-type recombinase/integrase [Streptomyces sp. CAI-85]
MSAQARKSPLRASHGTTRTTTLRSIPRQPDRSDIRQATAQDYATHLRASNNKHGRPYTEKTVRSYVEAVRALDQWMSREGVEGDFLSVGTDTLNLFFRAYFQAHSQGGTNSTQRNLRPFFMWLEEEHDHTNPYRDKKFQRYAPPSAGRPKTLSQEFIRDLLRTTGNGSPKVREFEKVRDHAIIRALTEGLRSEELLSLRLDSLDLEQGLAQVVPLKDARATGEGRIIPLQPKTVVALSRYIRAREAHKMADLDWLWLGTRNRGHLTYSGLYRMVNRRAKEAGYEGCHPHQFRHTATDDLLSAGVSGEDVMTIQGWKDPTMLRRYASDMAVSRAVKVAKKLGDRY